MPKRKRPAAGQSQSAGPQDQQGVLSSLPSTRLQRPSARRAAARRATAARAEQGAEPRPKRTAKAPAKLPAPERAAESKAKPTAKARAKPGAKPRAGRAEKTSPQPAAPRQGFEAEEQIEPGSSVQPPSGAELVASVAELFGELAQGSLSAGGRLLRDALTRLSGT